MLYRPKRNQSWGVDLSPLIDVVFLLLIFFMVSTRFKDDHGLNLELPKSESRQKGEDERLTLSVDADGVIYVGEKEVGAAQLRDVIGRELDSFPNKMVVLKVDKSVEHGTVVEIMDAAKASGAEGLTFSAAAKPAK